MPLYIRADNSVLLEGLQDSSSGAYISTGATLTFTVYRLVGKDGSIATGSTTLTTINSAFVAGDVGRSVIIPDAGANGSDLRTTIAAYVSATSVTLTAAASMSVARSDVLMSLDDAKDVSMPYVTGSDGNYRGTIDDAVPLRDHGMYRVEVAIDGGSGRRDFRVLELEAQYRE